jgi:hypothetical protein
LSSETPEITKILKERIQYTMPVQMITVSEKVCNKIHDEQKNENFFIHVASIVSGLPLDRIESMLFCISFLKKGKSSIKT